ncbi:MAG: outer membrane lipoprotein carrier protein LolA [Gammaproteobacteria bacterium RIFCSPHIGHO2_12_FULL_37_34]|nr:MAG: outer membrane lipoprotein carrier protein LolA [Gammaproteobacteria bacterium RIFCSPHIGHO2_12_FULL_37_34]
MLIRYFYIFLLISSYTTHVFASPSSELGNLLTSIKTIQASFTQTIYDNRNKPAQRSFGKMAMKRPDQFRWEVIKPIPQLIISNQSRLWIYDPDLEQVTIRSLKQTIGEAPSMLLNYNNAALDKEYVVTVLQKKSSTLHWFALTPKNPDNVFVAVQLGFANNIINQMRLQDHLGNTTFIQFENIKANTSLPVTLFVFKVPAGIDVIDETNEHSQTKR